MQYRRFGKTELQLPVFSLGTMRFSDAQTATEVISTALDYGITHLETAPAYGASECYIAEALASLLTSLAQTQPNSLSGKPDQRNREALILTSKIIPQPKWHQPPEQTATEVNQAIETSLARLGVSYLDCLAIHGLNTAEHLDWVRSHLLPALAQAQQDGRIRHLGFSTHGPLDVIQGAIATKAFAFVNLHYNYFFQRNAAAVETAHQQDMGVFIISPADKAGMLYSPPAKLKSLCAPYDPLLLNYRWLLSDPRITTLSVGPATAAELAWPLQVADTVGPLTATEQAAIERLDRAQVESLKEDSPKEDSLTDESLQRESLQRESFREKAPQGMAVLSSRCAQCYDCLPCPEAINIPEVLRLRNLAVAYDMQAFGQYRYGMFENAGHWFAGRKGDKCTDCGDCLPRCPEHLPIPNLLRDAHRRLAGSQRRRLWAE
jgi:uncharacterized protein